MAPKDKQSVRAYVMARNGAQKARVRADGGVEVRGVMPGGSSVGWYFAGWSDDLLTMAAAEHVPARRGAPPGPRIPLAERTKPRSVRLNDARWAKYCSSLGSAWLERAIDEAITGQSPTPG